MDKIHRFIQRILDAKEKEGRKMQNNGNLTDIAAQTAGQDKARQIAKEKLKEKGVCYPAYDVEITPKENYDRLLSYSEQEAALIVEYMRQPTSTQKKEFNVTYVRKPPLGSYYND